MVMGGDNTIGINKRLAPAVAVADFWSGEGTTYNGAWAASTDGDFEFYSNRSQNRAYIKNGGMVCYTGRAGGYSAGVNCIAGGLQKYRSVSFAASAAGRCGYGSNYEARGEAYVRVKGTSTGSITLLGADINNGNHHGEPYYGIGAGGYFTLSFDGDTMTINTSTYDTTSQSDGDGEDSDDDGAVTTVVADGTTQDISTWGDVYIQIYASSGGDSLNTYCSGASCGVITGTTGAKYGSQGKEP